MFVYKITNTVFMKSKNYLFFFVFLIHFLTWAQPATHLHLDGYDDFIGSSSPQANSYTKEVWIKPNNLTGTRHILSYNQSASVENHLLIDNGVLKAGNINYPDRFMSDNESLPLNEWTHIAVTVDEPNNVSRLYKNGVLIDTHTYVGQLVSVIYIGAQDFSGNNTFPGDIEEVRIWNIALTQEQIVGRMYCELRGDEEGLSLYYKFNSGIANGNNTSISQAFDTVSGLNYALTNFNLNGTTSNWVDGSPIISGISNPNLPISTNSYTYQVGDVATPLIATSGGTGLLWYDDLYGAGSTSTPLVDTSNPGVVFYWVSSTNANGCTSERVKITINILPSVDYGCWRLVDSFNHTLAIANNGTLWAWGKNATGELGLNDTTDRLLPTQVGTDSNWDKIAVGFSHSMALKTDGTLWTWGGNSNGQLGHGDTSIRQVPTQVGIDTNWLTINTKYSSSFALKQNKSLWAWGSNSNSLLGNGNTIDQTVPIQIGVDNDWEKLATTQDASFVIKSNGTLWSTGLATSNGIASSTIVFTQVGSDNDWKDIFNGHRNLFALKNDNTLWNTGANFFGDVGYDTSNPYNLLGTTFNKVLTQDWAYVGSGFRYTLAVKTDGTLWGWGNVAKSRFGLANSPYVPMQIGLESNWKQISSGFAGTLAVKSDSSIWSGGSNASGVLGLGDTTTRNQFEQVSCPCTSTTTWNGTIWSNGFPDVTKQVIFNGNYTGLGFSACSVQVNGTSIVLINSDETLHVQGIVTVAATATLEFQNNAYLVQVDNSINSGNIKVNRDSAPIIRLDYTAWSSPVANQNLLGFSPATLTNRFYTYEPSGTTTASAWIPVADPSSTNFTTGQGYLIRSANNWNATVLSPYNGLFEGVPNNGDITIPVTVGYNLLGNPYPSPIDNFQFITQNQGVGVNTLYYWTHTVPASGGVYPLNNYASYSKAGGVAAAAGGYKPVGLTQVGQGFISNINSVGNVEFKNNLRQTQSSGQFFRFESTIERHRIWLNLSDATNEYNQMMIAYMTDASNGFDQGIDGLIFTNSNTNIASIFDNERYVIQGRNLDFDDSDEVALSFIANQDGNYKISLDSFDGLFINQEIYIWDKALNIRFDIKQGDYIFSTSEGTFNDRFAIVYRNEFLGNDDFEWNDNLVVYIDAANHIQINNTKVELNKVEIYDVSGRLLFTQNKINSNQFSILNTFGNKVLLVRVTNENGIVLTKKVLK